MTPLLRLARQLWHAERRAFLRGLALSVTVLAMGAALLGLSGWFVTAAAAAGLAGLGIGFDFFRPSAGVRFLALGRAGARYGERMLTHDATLRALNRLRGTVWAGVSRLPHETQARLRGAEALNRLTADIDALDGLMLRLVLPLLAAGAVHLGAFVALWWLVTPATAAAVGLVYALGGTLALGLTARAAQAPATEAEAALQALRAASLDLMQSRADLAVAGALERQTTAALARAGAERAARDRLDRLDQLSGAALSLTAGLAATAALLLGGGAAQAGTITPAQAAIGFFVALALAETLALLRRGLADWGRMQGAARRVLALADTPARPLPGPADPALEAAPLLAVTALRHRRAGAARDTFGPLSFTLARGETLLVSGPSGAGKSTLLAVLAGLLPASGGAVRLLGQPLDAWPEADLRARLGAVPQRAVLLSGTVAENLRLALTGADPADPAAPAPPDAAPPDPAPPAPAPPEPEPEPFGDAQLWRVLEAVQLADVLRARDGLATRLGPGGAGLSGGQAKRLALARAALRRPEVLLLDEPSEGLDAPTARAMLQGLRGFLPQAGLVIVSHRGPDAALAKTQLTLGIPEQN